LGDIFQKKMRPTPKNFAQMAKFRPIWSHCSALRLHSQSFGTLEFLLATVSKNKKDLEPGLPDGEFSNQKNPYFGTIWKALQ
jgi:hypothetical protein